MERPNFLDRLNFPKTGPSFSEPVSQEDAKKFVALMNEIEPIIQRHGIDAFVVTACIKQPVGADLLVGSISAEDSNMAGRLLIRTQITVRQFCDAAAAQASKAD